MNDPSVVSSIAGREVLRLAPLEPGDMPAEATLYSLRAILGQIKDSLLGLPAEYDEQVSRAQQLAYVGEHLAERLTDRL